MSTFRVIPVAIELLKKKAGEGNSEEAFRERDEGILIYNAFHRLLDWYSSQCLTSVFSALILMKNVFHIASHHFLHILKSLLTRCQCCAMSV